MAHRDRLGSSGVIRLTRDCYVHQGSPGHRFGSSGLIMTQICFFGVIVAHYKGSSRLRCGSSGLKFGSLGLIRTQVSLIGGHCCSSGLNIWLIWTHWESDLAHQDSCWLIRTQVWLIGGHWGSSRLKIWLIRTHSSGLTGTQIWLI